MIETLPAPTVCDAVRIHAALPIFRIAERDRTVFYTPGDVFVTTPTIGLAVEAALTTGQPMAVSGVREIVRLLEHRGSAATRAWTDLGERAFEPECLTLYLSNRCNLGCSYCFAMPSEPTAARNRRRLYPSVDHDFPLLDLRIATAAARLVARHCVRKSKPLALVVHGGGEPTQHWDLLRQVRANVEQVAADHALSTFTYIATNGVFTEDRAQWLAANFHLIGLSCDGPPDIQNANRPTGGGQCTADVVERTARTFVNAGGAHSVRATIVPTTNHRQSEIVRYAFEKLGARTVRFEPAYDAKRTGGPSFRAEDAEAFVDAFLDATIVAREMGCDLRISGVRLDEIHGPYCNPLREVLQLTPEGKARGCFLTTDDSGTDDASMSLGHFDAASDEFIVDQDRASRFRRRAARVPSRCTSCQNVYHCARDCPDLCMLADPVDGSAPGFRCRVQKALGLHWIRETAARLPVSTPFQATFAAGEALAYQ